MHFEEIVNDPQQISKLRKFEGSYDWGGLTFLIALNEIGGFEQKNNVSVNVLAIGGEEKLYILRKSKFDNRRRTANLLLINQEYCADNKAIRIDMPEENSFVRFQSGEY